MKLIESVEWQGHPTYRYSIAGEDTEVPYVCYRPQKKEVHSLCILLHGQESSKDSWLEMGGYTKGGDFAKTLMSKNHPWIAPDLYGHGDWKAKDPKFDPSYLDDEQFGLFIESSVANIFKSLLTLISFARWQNLPITMVTYSVGGLIGLRLIQLGVPVEQLIMCVPTPFKEENDEFSMANNLDKPFAPRTLILGGKKDEEVENSETQWFFDQIQNDDKTLQFFESGHDLPIDWVNYSYPWLKK